MTSIVIFPYYENNNAGIFAIADTLIMGQDKDAKSTQENLKSGVKLFSIPLKVSRDYRYTDSNPEFFIDTSFGLAYAGNVALGLNLHAALSQIAGYLENHSKECNLGISDLADFSVKLLNDWHHSYNHDDKWTHYCEVSIFGFCPIKNKLKVFHLKPSLSTSEGQIFVSNEVKFEKLTLTSAITDIGFEKKLYWLIMGDSKAEIRKLILARMEDVFTPATPFEKIKNDLQFSSQYALEAAIHHKCFASIGGGLQVCFADEKGARPQRWIRPQSIDTPNDEYEWYSYLNYNLKALGKIGSAEIGDTGGLPIGYLPGNPNEVLTQLGTEIDKLRGVYRYLYIKS